MARRTKTVECDARTREARLQKAEEFLEAATVVADELPDAFVSLCVLAGIAAADVICCARLGVHATGDDHAQAVDLLARADDTLAKKLSQLLSLKSRSAYSDLRASAAMCRQAGRTAEALVAGARAVG